MSDYGELALKLFLTVAAAYLAMLAVLFVSAILGMVVSVATASAVLVPPRSLFT